MILTPNPLDAPPRRLLAALAGAVAASFVLALFTLCDYAKARSTSAKRASTLALVLAAVALVSSRARAQSSETGASPSLPPARWELAGGVSGSGFSSGLGLGSLFVKPILFLTPVRDTSAPRSLQPFLQGTSTISASLTGGAAVEPSQGRTSARAETSFGGTAAADVYLAPFLALTGGLAFEAERSFSTSAGVGLRLGDARFDVVYRFTAYDGAGTPPWGSIAVQTHLVLARACSVMLSTVIDDGGASTALNVGYYPSKDVGLFLGGAWRTAASYAVATGASYWVAPYLRVAGSYELDQQSPAIAHTLSIDALVRVP